MGTLFGFAVGYIVGARAGSDGFDEVVRALREVRDSAEFRAFVQIAKDHVRGVAKVVSERLGGQGEDEQTTEAMVRRARERAT